MIELIFPNPVLTYGAVVLATLPNHVEMWAEDNKLRPMVITVADEAYRMAVPLSTLPQENSLEIAPNISNNLKKASSVVHEHRVIFTEAHELQKVGQLTPAEQVKLRKILASNSIRGFHSAR